MQDGSAITVAMYAGDPNTTGVIYEHDAMVNIAPVLAAKDEAVIVDGDTLQNVEGKVAMFRDDHHQNLVSQKAEKNNGYLRAIEKVKRTARRKD